MRNLCLYMCAHDSTAQRCAQHISHARICVHRDIFHQIKCYENDNQRYIISVLYTNRVRFYGRRPADAAYHLSV